MNSRSRVPSTKRLARSKARSGLMSRDLATSHSSRLPAPSNMVSMEAWFRRWVHQFLLWCIGQRPCCQAQIGLPDKGYEITLFELEATVQCKSAFSLTDTLDHKFKMRGKAKSISPERQIRLTSIMLMAPRTVSNSTSRTSTCRL